MEANHRQQVEDLVPRSVATRTHRAVYLAEACSDNDSLRRNVESLAQAFEQSFMEQPALSPGVMGSCPTLLRSRWWAAPSDSTRDADC